MDGNKERDKKQSALPKELQEKFMTTDSAVLQTKKLNSGEHYADLDSVKFYLAQRLLRLLLSQLCFWCHQM